MTTKYEYDFPSRCARCSHWKRQHHKASGVYGRCRLFLCPCSKFEESMKTVHILASSVLPDEGAWTNRFRIKSESSSSIYIVSQHREKRHWACSCNGWTRRPVRDCKHLKALGLPGGEKPLDVRIVAGGAMGAEDAETYEQPRVAGVASPRSLPPPGKRKIDLS